MIDEFEKPDAKLLGADGNIFNLLAIASRALKDADLDDEADEMFDRVTHSNSYEEALMVILDYVNVV